jgi:hypothetical protein
VLLLVFEMRLLAGGVGSELRLPQKEAMTS